jgi:hypothetical protein
MRYRLFGHSGKVGGEIRPGRVISGASSMALEGVVPPCL